MKRALLTVCVLAATALAVHAQAPARRAAPPPPPRQPLFVGKGTAGWLPTSTLLPDAAAIEALAAKLGSRQRNVDPFGLSPFPREDNTPVVEEDEHRATPRITLNQALQTLKVNGVNLQRKEFLIGGRSAAEGDVLELAYKGEVFQAQILEVGAAQILFRDAGRQETGTLLHNVIPQLPVEPVQKVASRFEERLTPVEPAAPSRP